MTHRELSVAAWDSAPAGSPPLTEALELDGRIILRETALQVAVARYSQAQLLEFISACPKRAFADVFRGPGKAVAILNAIDELTVDLRQPA